MNAIDLMIYDPIAREGDFVDHPAHKGGPTRWGITEGVARRFGYMDRMERLPQDVAVAIYQRQYWHAPDFDKVAQIAPKLSVELLDTGVNKGTGTAICFL